jgi:putative flippase GtrA
MTHEPRIPTMSAASTDQQTATLAEQAIEPLLLFDPHPSAAIAAVDIVIPVHNEAAGLEASIDRLCAYLSDRFPLSWTVTIADNASTDRTWEVATSLAARHPGVRAAHLDQKGRGRALKSTWWHSTSPVVAYMDVDLSTDLDALLPLVAPLVSGHSDLAIGSRLARSSRVVRGPKREAISRSYNLILRAALQAGFSDAQCGFKAARSEALRALLPMVQDNGWFFDTELLVLAEHNGLRIHEVPVDWIDDPDSRVHIASTARADLQGIWRMMRSFARGEGDVTRAGPVSRRHGIDRIRTGLPEQTVRFASIGVVSTMAFALLYLMLAGPLGVVGADVVAFALCTLMNTAANRRLTFSVAGRAGRFRHHVRGLVAGAAPLTLNLAALGIAALIGIGGTVASLVVLTVVNAFAAVAKFTLLERWVFGAPGAAVA